MPVAVETFLQSMSDEDGQVLERATHACQQAQKSLSPRGLENYLAGAQALSALAKGPDLVVGYLEQMPAVSREVGEDVIADVVEAIMKLASLTSAAIMLLILGKLPMVATRLGDAEMLRAYLKLLHQLAASAPRGLRAMQEVIDELLTRLSLGGLRRWVNWGARTYRQDFEGQVSYFSLSSATARKLLERECRGLLFIDNQRKLNAYLRALWARAFMLRPGSMDYASGEGGMPYIEHGQIFLPDACDRFFKIEAINVYRAAAAHAAAHLLHTRVELGSEDLSPAQQCFVELFEDARVEFLATEKAPGLGKLWLAFFHQARESGAIMQKLHPMQVKMLALSQSLLDPAYRDDDASIGRIADDFRRQLAKRAGDATISLRSGLACHEFFSNRQEMPSSRILRESVLPYRDDNRYVWEFDEYGGGNQPGEQFIWNRPTRRKKVSLMEMVNEVDSELKDGRPQELWVLPTELFPYEDLGKSYNQIEAAEAHPEPYYYDEWDYQVQLARPHWCRLSEKWQGRGDASEMDTILHKYKHLANRIRYLIDAMQPRGVERKRGYEDGELLDIDAAVSAMIDMRRGISPDPRVNIRVTRHHRDLSVLLLLDLSASTNDKIGALQPQQAGYQEQASILDLTREASGLLAWAMDAIGDRFALHGFASDGRDDVQYYRFKDFDAAYDEQAKSRLAGMSGGLSTRMGAALRHAGWHLGQQRSRRRLVLMISDGAPADVDEPDPQYLRHDTRQAVNELAAKGIHSYCLTLDANAQSYAARIFGENNYSIVDKIERLPERLPELFSALTG